MTLTRPSTGSWKYMKKLNLRFLFLLLLLMGCNLLASNTPTETVRNESITATGITKLSQLTPYLGKRIVVSGLFIYGGYDYERKLFPYFLLNGNKQLRISLGVSRSFFDKLPKNNKMQAAIVSGVLSYYLIDLNLPARTELKKELENGDICFPLPDKYGEFYFRDIEIIKIIEHIPANAEVKEMPLTTEDKKIKDPRFAVDGKIEKFNDYIQHLIENNN